MYWADATAEKIIKKRDRQGIEEYVVSSGITPSGHIHVGNARETLTADGIHQGLKKAGKKSKLIFVADDYDPLRKLYPFLTEEYTKYIGMPLSEIPCPEGCCNSYAEHFLNPYLNSLKDLGIEITTYRASECYKAGMYNDAIIKALDNRLKIKEILDGFRKEPLADDWYPLNVVCEKCGKMINTKILGYNSEDKTITYVCSDCGFENTVQPFDGIGKLPWRVDWPARWQIFGVTAEPMGKDHGASGGSYDTGVKISRMVYGYVPPEKMIYEWIQLKVGDKAVPMSSSAGVVFAVKDWNEICHPEILRFLLVRSKPSKHIDFDLKGIPNIVDDYDELERKYFELIEKQKNNPEEEINTNDLDKIRLYEVVTANIPEKLPVQVAYKFCSIIAQIAIADNEEIDMERAYDILSRNGYNVEEFTEFDKTRLIARLEMSKNWAKNYGEKLIINTKEQAKMEYEKLSDAQKEWVNTFIARFEALETQEITAMNLHELIYEVANSLELDPKEAFGASYAMLLSKKYGPKLGSFLASLNREKVIELYK
ncbi:lysyl-tRNA synthetase class 1 [Methanococcus voltae]|uniref:lysine--tRNA ligase n=1 Tax=Methanococcus voltae TaxID=2188 RepID=UPI001AE5A3D4|nr:lysine--tRNA ligase [Methanococcus voltae]MBP2143492.1 lysyl-tRNA synthetase class 1 [Methanococcus voltae]